MSIPLEQVKESASDHLHQQVRLYIRTLIAEQRPDYLDSERLLQEKLKVSRTTIRRALRELEQEKLLLPIHGKGYRVNYAPEAGRAVTGILGVIVSPSLGEYESRVFSCLIEQIYRSGLRPLVAMFNPKYDSAPEKLAQLLAEADGVILCSHLGDLSECSALVQPALHRLTAMPYPSAFEDCSYINPNLERGFSAITTLLLKQGHRRIAFLGRDYSRRRGFETAFRRFGVKPVPELLWECYGYRHEGYRVFGELLKAGHQVTAVVCQNDPCALGVMERCFREGLRVPEDISITGADDVLSSELYPVPLTTIGINIEKMCRRSIELLLEGIRTGKPQPGELLSPTLVLRESVQSLN